MPLIFQHRVYRTDLQRNPKVVYVFGDNEARYGLGGQAKEMRGEPNSHGVATLKEPGVFWSDTDEETERQNRVLDEDLKPVFRVLLRGGVVVWPGDGIGTGLARMTMCAPRSFEHLCERVSFAAQYLHDDHYSERLTEMFLQHGIDDLVRVMTP